MPTTHLVWSATRNWAAAHCTSTTNLSYASNSWGSCSSGAASLAIGAMVYYSYLCFDSETLFHAEICLIEHCFLDFWSAIFARSIIKCFDSVGSVPSWTHLLLFSDLISNWFVGHPYLCQLLQNREDSRSSCLSDSEICWLQKCHVSLMIAFYFSFLKRKYQLVWSYINQSNHDIGCSICNLSSFCLSFGFCFFGILLWVDLIFSNLGLCL